MVCNHCKQRKHKEDFYRSQKWWCKECCKKHSAEYRANPDNREKQKTYYLKWYKENGRKRKSTLPWYYKNMNKVLVERKFQTLIRQGKVKRPTECSMCGRKDTRICAHHPDYRRPYFISWVCNSCHKLIHYGDLTQSTFHYIKP